MALRKKAPKHKCWDGFMRAGVPADCAVCAQPPAEERGEITVVDEFKLEAVSLTPEGLRMEGTVLASHTERCCTGVGCPACKPELTAAAPDAAEITTHYYGPEGVPLEQALADAGITAESEAPPAAGADDRAAGQELTLDEAAERAVEGSTPPLLDSVLLAIGLRRDVHAGLALVAVEVMDAAEALAYNERCYQACAAGHSGDEIMERAGPPPELLAELDLTAMPHGEVLNIGLAIAYGAVLRHDAETQPDLQFPRAVPKLAAPEYKLMLRRLADFGLI